MTVLSKTYINNSFDLEVGSIREREPMISSSLSAYFPFDGTVDGIDPSLNLLNSNRDWTLGTYGNQGNYIQNGEASANVIILKDNPWGVPSKVWASETNDVSSDADGGWSLSDIPVDKNKRYRFSVWMRRENMGNGQSYLGVQSSTVYDLGTTNVNTNPYGIIWESSDWSSYENEWLLWVFHVHPTSYDGSTLSDTGVYNLDGKKLSSGTDFKWTSSVTTSGHRSYLYYSTSVNERQYWYDPRIELNETGNSTISELLLNYTNVIHPTVDQNLDKSFREGIGVCSSTANLVPGVNFVWYPWNGLVGTYETYKNQYDRNAYHINVTGSGGVNYYELTSRITVSPSTQYTVSATYKSVNIPSANMFYVREYRSNGTAITENGYFSNLNTVYLQNGWKKAYATFTTTAETATINLQGYEYTAGVEIWIEDIQLEQKLYYTSYVTTSRSSAGNLVLPIQKNLSTYTIIGKFLPHTPFDGTYNYTADQSVLFMVSDASDAGHLYYRYWTNTGQSLPFLDLDGTFGTDHVHQNYTLSAHKELHYVVKKTGTSFDCKIYQDGAWNIAHSVTLSNDTLLNYINLGSDTVWNGDHRGLYVYDRVLSDNEIDSIVKGVQDYKSNGDLICYVSDNVSPNLWPNANLDLLPYTVFGNIIPTLKTDSYGTYHEMVLDNINSTYNGYDVSTNSGSTYVFSGWFWLSAGNNFDYAVLTVEGATSNSGYVACNALTTNQWIYAQMTFVSDGNVRCLIYPSGVGLCSGTLKWRNISIRQISNNSITLNRYGEMSVGEFSE